MGPAYDLGVRSRRHRDGTCLRELPGTCRLGAVHCGHTERDGDGPGCARQGLESVIKQFLYSFNFRLEILIMIYLLGVAGYIGNAYKSYLERRGIAFRSLSRSEVRLYKFRDAAHSLRRHNPLVLSPHEAKQL